MIKTKVTINGVEYTVRAKTDQEVLKAVAFLKEHEANKAPIPQFELTDEGEITGIELELNKSFDELLEDIETGAVVLPSRVDAPEFMVSSESATPATLKPKQSKFKQRLQAKLDEAARTDSNDSNDSNAPDSADL